MHKDITHYTDFDQWSRDVRHAGGAVYDRDHDTLTPTEREYFAMGWEGELGQFSKVTNTGYLYE